MRYLVHLLSSSRLYRTQRRSERSKQSLQFSTLFFTGRQVWQFCASNGRCQFPTLSLFNNQTDLAYPLHPHDPLRVHLPFLMELIVAR